MEITPQVWTQKFEIFEIQSPIFHLDLCVTFFNNLNDKLYHRIFSIAKFKEFWIFRYELGIISFSFQL